jgi:hypothetical protein
MRNMGDFGLMSILQVSYGLSSVKLQTQMVYGICDPALGLETLANFMALFLTLT